MTDDCMRNRAKNVRVNYMRKLSTLEGVRFSDSQVI